ncbi:MAG: hypothetical protein ACMV0Y_02480 [Paludibacter sp.]|jgi:hypothetical protein
MRKLLCPKCKIGRFRVRNTKGESIVVEVSELHEIIPIHEGVSLEGYNLDELFCLGCSWSGSAQKLVKH